MTGAEFGEVDIDLLADYIGGALTGTPDESVVAALIADDPAWSTAFAELSVGMVAVGAELGRFPAEPMPADLADLLDTMFAAPAAGPVAGDEPLVQPKPALTLVRGPDEVGDGALGVPHEKPAQRGRGARAGSGRRLRWATPIAIAAGVVAFVGFGLDYLAVHNSDSGSDSTASNSAGGSATSQDAATLAAGGPRALASGTDYTRATLAGDPTAQALNAPFSKPSEEQKAPREADMWTDALSRLNAPAALQDCLDAIAAENGAGTISAESVDYARFSGAPAVIVRFSAANGFWAWASGPACGTPGDGADTLDHVQVR